MIFFSCETDGGGPLVEDLNGLNVLYGLIDYRADGYCRQIITNRMGTYVDVSKFYDWIEEHKSDSFNSKASLKTISFALYLIIIVIFLNIWRL